MPEPVPAPPVTHAASVPQPCRIVVGISGASGAVYGVQLLQALRALPGVQSHLVVTSAGWRTLRHELNLGPDDMQTLASVVHDAADIGASIASGSFAVHGMAVSPCSMRTLAAIAHGLGDNLLTRAADVALKERRRLVLLTRESPLHLGHLRNMSAACEMGAIICPPVPAFYQRPATVADILAHTTARTLDLLGLPHSLGQPWQGLPDGPASA